jgi:hypothetical protein
MRVGAPALKQPPKTLREFVLAWSERIPNRIQGVDSTTTVLIGFLQVDAIFVKE